MLKSIMKTYEFTVIVERDAIRLHVEARQERGEPIYEDDSWL